MCVIVAHQFERFGLVARGDQRQFGIAFEWTIEVANLAVHARSQSSLGQPWADRGGNIRRGRSDRHFALRSIGQADC